MKYCDVCRTSYPNDFTICPRDQTILRVTSELVQGMIIRDKYQIEERIGSGGMATVYKAKHLAFNEIRAIKVVSSRMLEDENFLKRFKAEAVITRKLQHPNAVRVDDIDSTEDGRPFMVMELVEGKNLRQVIQAEGPLALPRSLEITRQVASALAAAHRLGITHRDIKPDNILLIKQADGSDLAKVLDFGIAKVREGAFDSGPGYTATQTGMVIGTPQYISPEQAMGKHGSEIDGRADLYSLGVVLYEMLTGKLPFESETPMGLLIAHIQATPRPAHLLRPDLSIPEPVSRLLMKAMEKNPEDRFQSADEMLTALGNPEAWASGAPMDADAGTVVMGSAGAAGGGTMVVGSAPGAGPAVTPRPRPAPTPRPTAAPTAVPPAPRPAPARRPAPPPPPPSRTGLWVTLTLIVLAGLGGGGWFYYTKSQAATAAAQQTATATTTQAVAPTDADLVKAVKDQFSQSDFLKNVDIQVTAHDGVVTLSSASTSASEADIAVSMASSVPGVKSVKSEMQAVKAATEPTQEQVKPKKEPQQPPTGPSRGQKAKARQLVAQADSLVDNGDYDNAIATYQQALEADPSNAAAKAGIAKAESAKKTEEDILRRRK